MKFTALCALAVFSLLGLTSTAFAGYDVGDKQYNFYTGLGAGQVVSGFATHTLTGGAVLGWQPHPIFALELGAVYLGSVGLNVAAPHSKFGIATAESISALIFSADLNGFNAFVRAGIADAKLGDYSNPDRSSTNPLFGLGVQYQYYHTLFVRAEVDHYSDFAGSGSSPLNAAFLLGMRF
jgi:hypothetical protein